MSGGITCSRRPFLRPASGLLLLGLLAGCDETGAFSLQDAFTPAAETTDATPQSPQTAATTERDIEAPEVFAASEAGLWDGRPSLGGVWVAHPDVTEPERVIIRNKSNGQFVVGALFRRERDIPGPRLQMSSDAAEALGVLAGAPAELEVVALRKEIVAPARDAAAEPQDIEETALDPIAAAEAAIDAAPDVTPAAATAAATTIDPPQPAPSQSTLQRPFIQIGIFSQQANAERAAKQMRGAGLIPTIKEQQLGDKPFWRVVVGPATDAPERDTLLSTIKSEGFSDAYAVTN